jgi:hypothetical protein
VYAPSLFHENGFNVVELESGLTWQGPFSSSRPNMLDDPGPPFIHIDSGALAGSLRDSKNQKNVLME